MIRSAVAPNIGIERIDPGISDELVRVRARQITDFMRRVVHPYYEVELGCTFIDTDPRPNPDDSQHLEWRQRRVRASGPVQHTGLSYIGAFMLDGAGLPRIDDDAMVGMLVLAKPDFNQLCREDQHTPTEIIEFDVESAPGRLYRGIGLGRELLRFGMADVHPEDQVRLMVADVNTNAQAVYANYGFEFTGERESLEVFDVVHFEMTADGGQLRQRLGV